MQPQTCTKCGSLPQDILMLACNHDLCLNCAAQRLSHQSKKKPATGINCQFCNQKTQLDPESIYELQKILVQLESKKVKNFKQNSQKIDLDSRKTDKYDRSTGQSRPQQRQRKPDYGLQVKPSTYSNIEHVVPKDIKSHLTSSYGGLNKKTCSEHPDQELLYFCFECNCQCICPECIIHGKHKNHQVKTLKKSQPIIKGRLQNFLQNIDNNVQGLMMKKNQFEKHIKDFTDENNICKKQIQKSFAELKAKINNKQKQILGKCDKALEITIEQYQKGIKLVTRKMDDIKQSAQLISETLKKQQLILLNFYARKNFDFQQIVKKVDLDAFLTPDADKILSNNMVIQFVNHLNSEIVKLDINSSIKYDPKYDEKPQISNYKNLNDQENDYPKSTKQKFSRDDERNREYVRKY